MRYKSLDTAKKSLQLENMSSNLILGTEPQKVWWTAGKIRIKQNTRKQKKNVEKIPN